MVPWECLVVFKELSERLEKETELGKLKKLVSLLKSQKNHREIQKYSQRNPTNFIEKYKNIHREIQQISEIGEWDGTQESQEVRLPPVKLIVEQI